jgi:biotin transport system permease protein
VSSPATYLPGNSLLHRCPAGTKLLGLLLAAVALVVLPAWWHSLVGIAVALGLHALARLPWRAVVDQVRSLLLVLLAIGVIQVVLSGWRSAVDVTGTIMALVLLAEVVTLTTSTTALTEVVVAVLRPLRRFGVQAERIGLLISLSIRSIAVIATLAAEVREAQRARGLAASPRAFAVPLLVRSLRHAERLGEALVARGFDD